MSLDLLIKDAKYTDSDITEMLLTENRVDEVRKKFPDVPEDNWDILVNGDPSKNHAYLPWLAKNAKEEYTSGNAAYSSYRAKQAVDLVKRFHRRGGNHERTDLYSFKSLGELKEYLEKSKTNTEREEDEIDLVYEDEDWKLTFPRTRWAMCREGGSTKWCVATSNEEHWDIYYPDFLMFVLVPKFDIEDRIDSLVDLNPGEDTRELTILRNLDERYVLSKIAIVYPGYGSAKTSVFWDRADEEFNDNDQENLIELLPEALMDTIDDYDSLAPYLLDERRDELRIKLWHDRGETETYQAIIDATELFDYDVDPDTLKKAIRDEPTGKAVEFVYALWNDAEKDGGNIPDSDAVFDLLKRDFDTSGRHDRKEMSEIKNALENVVNGLKKAFTSTNKHILLAIAGLYPPETEDDRDAELYDAMKNSDALKTAAEDIKDRLGKYDNLTEEEIVDTYQSLLSERDGAVIKLYNELMRTIGHRHPENDRELTRQLYHSKENIVELKSVFGQDFKQLYELIDQAQELYREKSGASEPGQRYLPLPGGNGQRYHSPRSFMKLRNASDISRLFREVGMDEYAEVIERSLNESRLADKAVDLVIDRMTRHLHRPVM